MKSEGKRSNHRPDNKPPHLSETYDPNYIYNKDYACEKGPSGFSRWAEPFSKVDMFGKPTVFSPRFMEE